MLFFLSRIFGRYFLDFILIILIPSLNFLVLFLNDWFLLLNLLDQPLYQLLIFHLFFIFLFQRAPNCTTLLIQFLRYQLDLVQMSKFSDLFLQYNLLTIWAMLLLSGFLFEKYRISAFHASAMLLGTEDHWIFFIAVVSKFG